MKILIADDERLIRVNLISMIQELYGYTHIIEEAKDGSELQKKLLNDIYDLVFVDINMPKKSGLDVVEEHLAKNKSITWCVLSGYADFEYAKRAISLGVKEYLLKPVDIDDLQRFMDTVIQDLEVKRQKEHLLYEKKVNQAFVLADSLGIIRPLEVNNTKHEYSLFVFFMDASDHKQRQHIFADLYRDLLAYVYKNIDTSDRFALFILQTGELCLLIEGREYSRMKTYLQKYGDKHQNAKIVAIYTRNIDFQHLYDEKQQILEFTSMHILMDNLSVLSLQDISEYANRSDVLAFCEKIERITSCYLTGDYSEALNSLREMENDTDLQLCFETINKDAVLYYLFVVWNVSFAENSFSGVLSALKMTIQKQLENNRNMNYQLIQQIKNYVKDNYMNNMSITDISDNFNITPSYISRIFKEKTGEKLIDYITGVRMRNARELLLSETQLSMKEVAQRVGYSSEKHFSKIFKKYYNCLPSKITYSENEE